MHFSIHQVYTLLCFIFMCLMAMGQPESVFYNYDGKLGDEASLAPIKKIKGIEIYHSVNGSDTCKNSVLKFDNHGNLLSRKNYACIKDEQILVYYETFRYNSRDSVTYEHYVSKHGGLTYEHIKNHSYLRRKDTIIKTTIVSDSTNIWDSIITKYSMDGRIYEVSKKNPTQHRGSAKSRIYETYKYEGGKLISIKSEIAGDHTAKYTYDATNRIISVNTVTGSGVVDEQTGFTYDDRGNIIAETNSFPDQMKTEYTFNDKNQLLERRYYEYDHKEKQLKLVSTNTYKYYDNGLISDVYIKLSRYNFTTTATLKYIF